MAKKQAAQNDAAVTKVAKALKKPAPVKTIPNEPWVDIKGEALYKGCIVAVPMSDIDGSCYLCLGYIHKVTVKTIYVTAMIEIKGAKTRQEMTKFTKDNVALSVVAKSQLKLTDPFHEALRYAAGSIVD